MPQTPTRFARNSADGARGTPAGASRLGDAELLRPRPLRPVERRAAATLRPRPRAPYAGVGPAGRELSAFRAIAELERRESARPTLITGRRCLQTNWADCQGATGAKARPRECAVVLHRERSAEYSEATGVSNCKEMQRMRRRRVRKCRERSCERARRTVPSSSCKIYTKETQMLGGRLGVASLVAGRSLPCERNADSAAHRQPVLHVAEEERDQHRARQQHVQRDQGFRARLGRSTAHMSSSGETHTGGLEIPKAPEAPFTLPVNHWRNTRQNEIPWCQIPGSFGLRAHHIILLKFPNS